MSERRTLQSCAWYIPDSKMSSVPEYAAVDESVQLAKKYARGRDKFINGVLRSYIRDRYNITLPDREKELVKYLSVKYSTRNG